MPSSSYPLLLLLMSSPPRFTHVSQVCRLMEVMPGQFEAIVFVKEKLEKRNKAMKLRENLRLGCLKQ